MAEPKQQQEAYLNQPYYGPTVLPAGAESSRPSRPTLDGYSLICFFFKIFTTILIVVGIVVLALWLIYQPQSIKVYADTAVLSVFNLSNSGNHSSLTYNLTLTLSFRNPNRKYDTNYERLNADASYSNHLHLSSVALPRFRQNRKSTTLVSTRFEGRAEVPPGDRRVEEAFGRERDEGFFGIRIRMYATLRLKMVVVQSVKFKPDVDCYLRIPSPTNATSLTAGFHSVECDVYNFS
ncbi:hypothetical protein HPP92_000055 [Vanilla planifolia]|uniref:Late embryogenesis abundant protein LEA-2 subgroup domain-containing protein n=1 Tax=Vanilla planifolia TaxID=51239 RepID=A0A835S9X7_VANPL|nr:hypothetical protein HPP92_000055 [Vanilla planifolia]